MIIKMKIERLCELAQNLGCKVSLDKSLKDYTTFRVGGRCPALIEINSEQSLSELVRFCFENNLRYMVLGKGSNMLCDDKGYDGAVLLMSQDFSEIRLIDDETIEVQAGCSLIRLCMFALENSLTGLEFAYGIPGTVGGAVFMNAGAYGGEIKDVIYGAKAVDPSGALHSFSKDMLDLSYRGSVFQKNGYIVTTAVFKLKKGDKSEIQAKMNELMSRRKEKQPLEYPNAGSTFKRPEGQFAGKLIQDSGLRGASVGGAQVSEKHCGFIINRDNATADDIKLLIKKVQDTVFEKTGFHLECEVEIIPYSE